MFKPTHLLLLSLIVLVGCKEEQTPEEPEIVEDQECVLDGSFILVNDSVSGSLQNTDSLLIEELSFFKDYCTLTFDSIGYRGTYGCLEPYVWVAVEGFDTLRLEQIDPDEMIGQGFIQGRYLRKGSAVFEQALAELTVNSTAQPESNSENDTPVRKDKPKDEVAKVNDKVTTPPLNNGGLKPATISFGDNLAGNTYRVRLYEPYTGGIKSNMDAKLYLTLTVDAQGNIMKVENNASKSTTTDSKLLEDVIALVKKIKYNKESGAKLAKVPMTVTVNVH